MGIGSFYIGFRCLKIFRELMPHCVQNELLLVARHLLQGWFKIVGDV